MSFLRSVLVANLIALSACVTHADPAFAKQTTHIERTWFGSARDALPRVAEKYDTLLEHSAQDARVSKVVILSLMMTESMGNANAPHGGLMQTTSIAKKATGLSCDEHNPACSMKLGARYFRYISDTYHLSFPRTVIAYNRGPTGARTIKDPTRDPYYQRVAFILSTLSTTSTTQHSSPNTL